MHLRNNHTRDAAVLHARAWVSLTGALALHVVDESLTGFLDFYNPLVLRMRAQVPWFPMPTFTFGVWLAGLVLLVLILACLTPVVRKGALATSALSWMMAVIMFMNGVGHLVGSIYFQNWLPGSTSAPLLLAASAFLARTTWARRHQARPSF